MIVLSEGDACPFRPSSAYLSLQTANGEQQRSAAATRRRSSGERVLYRRRGGQWHGIGTHTRRRNQITAFVIAAREHRQRQSVYRMPYQLSDNESRRRWRTRRVSVEGDIEGVDSGFSTRNWARIGLVLSRQELLARARQRRRRVVIIWQRVQCPKGEKSSANSIRRPRSEQARAPSQQGHDGSSALPRLPPLLLRCAVCETFPDAGFVPYYFLCSARPSATLLSSSLPPTSPHSSPFPLSHQKSVDSLSLGRTLRVFVLWLCFARSSSIHSDRRFRLACGESSKSTPSSADGPTSCSSPFRDTPWHPTEAMSRAASADSRASVLSLSRAGAGCADDECAGGCGCGCCGGLRPRIGCHRPLSSLARARARKRVSDE